MCPDSSASNPSEQFRGSREPNQPPLLLSQPSFSEACSQSQDVSEAELHGKHKRLHSDDIHGTSSAAPGPSESPFGHLSPQVTDRVFPIRSVVSVDPSSTPRNRVDTTIGDGFPGLSLPNSAASERTAGSSQSAQGRDDSPSERRSLESVRQSPSTEYCVPRHKVSQAQRRPSPRKEQGERMGGARQMSTFSDAASLESHQATDTSAGEDAQSAMGSLKSMRDDTSGLVTARFKHTMTEGGHAVIIGRDGDTLQRCEDEPIHIPGAIQSFGLLLALQEMEEGKLQVKVASENSRNIIGYSPKQLFALESFTDILSDEQADNLLDHVDFISSDDVDPATSGPEVFTLSIRTPSSKIQKLWCAIHLNRNNPDLLICEFELEDDRLNPLVPVGEGTPEPPEDTLQSEPTPEEYAESTVNASKPLRVLRGARKRKGEAAAMEVFNIMSQVQEQLANAVNLETFLKTLVGVVKELTGFHRVMIYQFDQAWNGRVVTELVDPRATKDLYKGLNFPASDIPKQARDLYKLNKVRLLYDRDQETSRLVCRTVEDLETPLDLSYAYLRAMSPIHIKYLANMAVRASMSISINAFDELWGLIACHTYGSKGMRVSFPIRKMCRLVGDSASRNIERLSYASRLQARKLINTVPTESKPSGYIIASSDDLLNLFDAEYGLLSIRDETKILGKLEQTQEALALLEYLRLRKITSVTNSTDIRADFPDLIYPPGFTVISGLLLVPLSVAGSDFIVFFRGGQIREVKWAGNPYEKFVKEGTEGYLEPRKSFKTWSETVAGRCKEWTEEQIETAAVLCLVYGKFIEVWRQKEAALQNSQLTRILLANSAHEVRTPLNAIINYLEIALEGAIDSETRENLSRSHSASKSLIYVINDLLDLTKTEEGHNLVKDEIFDLPATVRAATSSFTGDAKRKNIEYNVVEMPGVPQYVMGDQRRVRQAVTNVTANAIKHTSNGAVNVEIYLSNHDINRAEVDIVVQDTGVGMSSEKLDSLFRDLEQAQTQSDEGRQEKLVPDSNPFEGDDNNQSTIGLGLAVVARIVRNMNGQLRVKSEEGKGSRFMIQLGFELPQETDKQAIAECAKAAGIGTPSQQPRTPTMEEGEITLVHKSAQKAPDSPKKIVHRKSTESVYSLASMHSFKSGSSGKSAKSDVDRLIEAIQEPQMISKDAPAGAETDGSRQSSRRRKPGSATASRRPISGLSRPPSFHMTSSQSSEHASQAREASGFANVVDTMTPIKPVRMPGEVSTGSPVYEQTRGERGTRTPARVLFDHRGRKDISEKPLDVEKLAVLVAEDDPINSKIVHKRLEKLGHQVYLTINGEECASLYGEGSALFDVVLMDMQVSHGSSCKCQEMLTSGAIRCRLWTV